MFKDVPENAWYAKGVIEGVKDGVISGFPDGTFRPNEPLTRAQYAVIRMLEKFRDGVFTDILPVVMPAVCLVHRGDALGSGACITRANGFSYIVTNAHVVGDKTSGFCVKDDDTPNFDWTLHAKNPELDLAVVKTTREMPALTICTDLQLGEPVAVLGAPKGHTDSVCVGVVSHLNRMEGLCFQTDAPISPGNSGGPVVNERGQLVGVVVAKYVDIDTEGIGYAIKPSIVKEFISRLGL